EFLASAQAKLDLYTIVLKVELERYQGLSFCLYALGKPCNLAPVHQQLAIPQWCMIHVGALFIFGDMDVLQPYLSVSYAREGSTQIHFAGANGFHLGTCQYNAGLDGFIYEVIVIGLTICRHDIRALSHRRRSFV